MHAARLLAAKAAVRVAARIALASARPRDLSGLRDTLARIPAIVVALARPLSLRPAGPDVGHMAGGGKAVPAAQLHRQLLFAP